MLKLSDSELLLLIQQGEHLAFAQLVERHNQRFYRLAFRYLNQRELAEDTVQEAFIQLWEKPKSFNLEQSLFTTWFYRVIINKCLDQKKRKKPVALGDEQDFIDELRLDHEQSLIEKEQRHWLESAINALPNSQRTAVNLCFFDDLSNQQAANIMELSLKSLQSLIMRAKTKLKIQYQTDMRNDNET